MSPQLGPEQGADGGYDQLVGLHRPVPAEDGDVCRGGLAPAPP